MIHSPAERFRSQLSPSGFDDFPDRNDYQLRFLILNEVAAVLSEHVFAARHFLQPLFVQTGPETVETVLCEISRRNPPS